MWKPTDEELEVLANRVNEHQVAMSDLYNKPEALTRPQLVRRVRELEKLIDQYEKCLMRYQDAC